MQHSAPVTELTPVMVTPLVNVFVRSTVNLCPSVYREALQQYYLKSQTNTEAFSHFSPLSAFHLDPSAHKPIYSPTDIN